MMRYPPFVWHVVVDCLASSHICSFALNNHDCSTICLAELSPELRPSN